MTEREVVTLKEYIDTKIEAINKSTLLAADMLNARLESMNEFREALKNQNALFITRAELNAIIEKICSDIQMLRESKAMLEGKASQQSVNVVTIMSVIGLLCAVISLILAWR